MSRNFTVFHRADGETIKRKIGSLDECLDYIMDLAGEFHGSGHKLFYRNNGFTASIYRDDKFVGWDEFSVNVGDMNIWQD